MIEIVKLKYIIFPIIYILIGTLIYNITKAIINKSFKIDKIVKDSHKQRIKTIKLLLLNIIKYIIVIIVILANLSLFGVNIKSILAGLGITTAIIGLAFQDLAKDIIAGFSIITENQYEVGDTIEVDGFMGKVVSIGLKTTRIRDYKGATKIISNHNMDKIINYSIHDSLAVVDVGVDYSHNAKEIESAIEELAKELDGKIPSSLGKLENLGIVELDSSAVIYRVIMKVKPMEHIATERIIRKEIKKKFDEKKIKIPFPQVEVHNGK